MHPMPCCTPADPAGLNDMLGPMWHPAARQHCYSNRHRSCCHGARLYTAAHAAVACPACCHGKEHACCGLSAAVRAAAAASVLPHACGCCLLPTWCDAWMVLALMPAGSAALEQLTSPALQSAGNHPSSTSVTPGGVVSRATAILRHHTRHPQGTGAGQTHATRPMRSTYLRPGPPALPSAGSGVLATAGLLEAQPMRSMDASRLSLRRK
jgi:hypothetical protein